MSKEVVNKKKQFELKIEDLAIKFFAINKNDESLSSKRKTLKNKLWVLMIEYYKLVYRFFIVEENKNYYENIDIITDTSLTCLENYNSELEIAFLHYSNSAVKKELKYQKLKNSREVSDIMKDENGKEISTFDLIESKLHNPIIDFELKESRERAMELLEIIDKCFLNKQERVKKYLSALLTHKLFDAISILENYNNNIDFQFISSKLYQELNAINKPQAFPKQQDIAKRFGKDKTDASRALKKFFIDVEKSVNFMA